jgi:hypothetical protein
MKIFLKIFKFKRADDFCLFSKMSANRKVSRDCVEGRLLEMKKKEVTKEGEKKEEKRMHNK